MQQQQMQNDPVNVEVKDEQEIAAAGQQVDAAEVQQPAQNQNQEPPAVVDNAPTEVQNQ